MARAKRQGFNGSRFEVDRPTCLQGHQRTDRKRARDRRDQALNPTFVPHPAALKIWQLKNASMTILENFVQLERIGLEHCSRHR